MNNDPAPRHHLFEAARQRAELSVHELWLRYVAVTGNCDAFDVDAYLHGVASLTSFDQDVLALALNERLDDLYREARVPYLNFSFASPPFPDPLAIIEGLLTAPAPPPPTAPRAAPPHPANGEPETE